MPSEEKDELYWAVVKAPQLSSDELMQYQKELSAAEALLYVDVYEALDGQIVIVKKHPDNTYILWDWPMAADAKVRDAYYAIEQDPVFGAFAHNRKGFDKAWEEGWAIQTTITLAKDFLENVKPIETDRK